jgi:AraC family transcriptional regulator
VLVLRPQVDILEVALDSGFSSASAFARAFKERFGMSATDWRRGCNSNPGIADRKTGKAGAGENHHSAFTFGAGADAKESNMDVKIETLPATRVAYLRQIGTYTPAAISGVAPAVPLGGAA